MITLNMIKRKIFMKYYRMYWLLYIVSIFCVFLFEDYVVSHDLLSNRLYLCLFEIVWAYFGISSYWIGTITHKHNIKNKSKQKNKK